MLGSTFVPKSVKGAGLIQSRRCVMDVLEAVKRKLV